jgi:hypothetical protein
MRRDITPPPGIDAFWEDADAGDSCEHPLERELCDRLDALARYRTLIDEAQVNGRDAAAARLIEQQRRETQVVQRIRRELIRTRDRDSRSDSGQHAMRHRRPEGETDPGDPLDPKSIGV